MDPLGVSPIRRRLMSCNEELSGCEDATSPQSKGAAAMNVERKGTSLGEAVDCADIEAECSAVRLDETSLHAIFQHLADPADLQHAREVCREWHRVIIEGNSWRAMCNRLIGSSSAAFAAGEVSGGVEQLRERKFGDWFLNLSAEVQQALLFRHLSVLLSVDPKTVYAGRSPPSSSPADFVQVLEEIELALGGIHQRSVEVRENANGVRENLIVDAIAASTTDNYPEECISKTLKELPRERLGNMLQACYWSSKGDANPNKDECLLYQLAGPMCLVTGFCVRPFKAFFQPKQPVYSSAFVRFKLGHRVAPEPKPEAMDASPKTFGGQLFEQGSGRRRDSFREADFVWTYESPRYAFAQEDKLQRFDLPAPVLCEDGVVRVELIGKVQRQEDYDNLFYVCITHVRALGVRLPCFQSETEPSGRRVLKYCADNRLPPPEVEVSPQRDGPIGAVFVAEFDESDEEQDDGMWD